MQPFKLHIMRLNTQIIEQNLLVSEPIYMELFTAMDGFNNCWRGNFNTAIINIVWGQEAIYSNFPALRIVVSVCPIAMVSVGFGEYSFCGQFLSQVYGTCVLVIINFTIPISWQEDDSFQIPLLLTHLKLKQKNMFLSKTNARRAPVVQKMESKSWIALWHSE